MWCLKAKKNQTFIEFLDQTQKSPASRQKKVSLGFRGFGTYFWEVEHPLCDVWKQKTQILIDFLDWTQKSPASRQKKFPSCQKKFP